MQRGGRPARGLRQFGNVDLDTTVQRVPDSSLGESCSKINNLEAGVTVHLPTFRRWEEHGKMASRLCRRPSFAGTNSIRIGLDRPRSLPLTTNSGTKWTKSIVSYASPQRGLATGRQGIRSSFPLRGIRSRGAFDAARDWRDAHPEGPEAVVLRKGQETFERFRSAWD